MKYMVVECHLSYAVVLDEDGRFLKVANRHYELGQTVTNVIEMQDFHPAVSTKQRTYYKWISSIVAMAACLMLIVTARFQFGSSPYASVYMTINPEVRIDINKQDIVIDVEGINEDGKALIEDYIYKKKSLDLVMDELVDRAIELNFLHEGGQIILTLDADDDKWIVTKSDTLDTHLHEYLTNKLSVTIEITNKTSQTSGITIPLIPDSTTLDTDYDDSDYGETTETTRPSIDNQTNYDVIDYDDTSYGDSDYNSHDNGKTNYSDTDSDSTTDSDTDYDSSADSQTDYENSDYDSDDDNTNDDGDSDYDD